MHEHNVKAKAKEKGKNGVGLASDHKPKAVPHHLVDELKTGRVGNRLVVEVEMLNCVEHENHSHGNASDGIRHFNTFMCTH